MKKNPKVSIIIPVYRGKEFMREAIDSALNQTYENIEIIVVNDGSDDNGETRKIALSYGEKIKYFEKENGGVSTALNLALEKMSGDYFSWLSHDDRYYPEKIESQINYLRNYDEKTILYSDYDLMDENSSIFAKNILNHKELNKKMEFALLRGAINGITLLIPRNAFLECGNFREDLRCTQDYELWYRMMKKYKFVHQDCILATTRLHKNQTGNTSPKVVSENNILWKDLIEGFDDDTKNRLCGSVYNYYYEMREFIKTTNFEDVLVYLDVILNKYDEEFKKIAEDILVSVVIPVCDNQSEFDNAIKSVLNQTHKNLEIIVVDDSINSKINVKKFKSSKIKYYKNKEHSGASFSRNFGINVSNGNYIAFLDSDDLFLSNKVECQLLDILKRNGDFSYTSYLRKYSDNTEEMIDCSYGNENIISNCIWNCLIATPTVMIKKDFLLNTEILYDSDVLYGEDVIFYLNIFKNTNPLYYDDYLTIVNVDNNSSSFDINKQIEGTRCILRFLFNDDYYSNKISELSMMCYGFYNLVSSLNICSDNCNNGVINQSRFKRWIGVLKDKGLVYCLKRFISKYFKGNI